ncbi:helix-turn-helix protein [Chryseobacterium sp. CBTAP 102]|uniref:Helix-turn-helix domain-containing protein n=2 Tax=Chryseobacterium TaxID=59732 RepID=A0ABY2R993_9FLAO|nr:helix-turn-helix protein [Chryseobacterium sp. CBTAP 102]THV62178.1 helix-turn-helix domain-containing protein [Chryseobacterium candidae]SIQ86812.1 Helix-turn-helix domain-containing protein [Chryseobacterium sp. RU33C]
METSELLYVKEREFMKNFVFCMSPFYFYMGCFYYIVDPNGITHLIIFTYFASILIGLWLGLKLNMTFKFLTTLHILVYTLMQYCFYITYNTFLIQALYYIPAFLILNYLYSLKVLILWSAYIVISFLSPFVLDNFFNFSHPLKLSRTEEMIQNISTFVAVIFGIFFIFHYLKIFNKIKQDGLLKKGNEEIQSAENHSEPEAELLEDHSMAHIEIPSDYADKFDELYQRIIAYIEENKVWQNADFSISQLAEKLSSNRTYISKALREKGKTNFNNLLNTYRVRQVLQDFENLEHKNYKISFIYRKAGFSYQASFSRVFKEITGYTATEYLKRKEKM